MAKMITMPPTKDLQDLTILGPVHLYSDSMSMGTDNPLTIKINDPGTFFGTPQGNFTNHDVPPPPGITITAVPNCLTGTAVKTGSVTLVYYDSSSGDIYVCVLTINP